MPIAVFNNTDELRAWCKDTVSPDKYRVLSTDEDEIILEPTKTSRPLKFGYLQIPGAEALADEIAKEFNLKHIHIKAYRWDTDKGPHIKISAEEF